MGNVQVRYLCLNMTIYLIQFRDYYQLTDTPIFTPYRMTDKGCVQDHSELTGRYRGLVGLS
jgi:hypothetical protein